MTIRHIIQAVSRLRDTPLSEQAKIDCLSELDCKIYEDIILRHEGAEAYTAHDTSGKTVHRTFPYTTDTQELIAPPRFQKMYVYYLCMEIDLALDEIDRYTNDLILFNDLYNAFAAHYNETHMPLHEGKIITAPKYTRRDADALRDT